MVLDGPSHRLFNKTLLEAGRMAQVRHSAYTSIIEVRLSERVSAFAPDVGFE